jgi:hypothetical protein
VDKTHYLARLLREWGGSFSTEQPSKKIALHHRECTDGYENGGLER